MAQSCAEFDVNTNALLHGHDSWLRAGPSRKTAV